MPSKPRYYWDADVFLSYIEGNDSSRLSHIRPLLEDAEKNLLEIVTSALTIVEVAYAPYEKAATVLDQGIEDAIAALWAIGSPVRVVEVDAVTAVKGRQLVREGIGTRRAIKPNDAVHLVPHQATFARFTSSRSRSS